MKILWFTNTPCSAIEKLNLNTNSGGWLSSLEQELTKHDSIELYIAFYHTQTIAPFIHKNTRFYPIMRKNSGSKLQRYIARLLMLVNNDKIEINQLLSLIEQVNPDLIHIHGTEENFGLIQNHTKIPVVVSIQGLLSPIVEKYFSGIPSYLVRKYQSFKNILLIKSTKYNYKTLYKKSIRERQILKISKNIIGRTDWDKRITRITAPNSNYFIGQEMLRSSFYKNSWQRYQFNKKIQIITVSSNKVYKGFETIIKTATILSNYPKIEFEWLVIGLEENSEIVLLTQKWLKINPENIKIKLLGEKDELEIVNILSSADIYCQVSHIENSPNSLCEAMILGLPIIASFAGGTDTLLENRKEGILVQDGDPYSYAGAIVELANNYQKAEKYAKNARYKAIERHDKRNITNALIAVYNQIISSSVKQWGK